MRGVFVSVLVLLFAIGIILFAWNGFRMPKVFLSKTSTTTARVFYTKVIPGHAGRGYLIVAKYAYVVEGKTYCSQIKTSRRDGLQFPGNTLIVEYSERNPDKHEVRQFNNEISRRENHWFSFTYRHKDGYKKLTVFNRSIVHYEDYAMYGKLKEEWYGEGSFSDSIYKVRPVGCFDTNIDELKFALTEDSIGHQILVDLDSEEVFVNWESDDE